MLWNNRIINLGQVSINYD